MTRININSVWLRNKTKLKANKKLLYFFVFNIYFLFHWVWLLSTNYLDLAGNRRIGLAIAWVVLISSTIISSLVMLAGIIYSARFLKNQKFLVAIIFGLPLLAFFDFLTSWLISIIWIGPEGSIDTVLPFGSPALILVNTPIKYLSRIIGFYGLSAILWFIVLMIYSKKPIKFFYMTTISSGNYVSRWVENI